MYENKIDLRDLFIYSSVAFPSIYLSERKTNKILGEVGRGRIFSSYESHLGWMIAMPIDILAEKLGDKTSRQYMWKCHIFAISSFSLY